MMSDPLFYKLLLVGLLWLCLMLHVMWPDDRASAGQQTSLLGPNPTLILVANPYTNIKSS